ncbi:cell adhesion domain-containing protein [Clostridium botulinum B str. Osaka05]|uniref:Cell adhesion domain-containing protein n=1 Tax=Clostridium botulinum B str. Osaka05 TaxID=1407017 RepID=A0A060N5M8_CLOBO|nr:discoidin domain-containing protein [Clostridium botulinum]BAO04860.1 cell adhesion domain-containing protein [Clostridium botulinum B str. Osaka05]
MKVNLALNQPVFVSHNPYENYTTNKINDGILNSEDGYYANQGFSNVYINIELEKPTKIGLIKLKQLYFNNLRRCKEFEIRYSDDNIKYNTISNFILEDNDSLQDFKIQHNAPHKFWGILIKNNYGSISTNWCGIGEIELYSIYNKYLIKQNSNYYSINNNYIDLGKIDNNEELNNIIDEYGYNDLSILTKELNNKKIPTKLENDYYKSFDINLNDIKDNINLIEENDKKYIECGCNNYKISDKVKEINNAKFEVLMKE